jgi:uncharacterized protein YacL (UPF0231 family)
LRPENSFIHKAQIKNKMMPAKIISGIVVTISLMVGAFVLVPSFWFWASFELLAALLVAYGCIGEWYLHHHPAGRAKRDKDAHHKQEARYIFAVAIGVAMEFFIVAHSIQEGVKMEVAVADANERAGKAEHESAQANERAAKFDADRVMVEKQAEEIRSTNLLLQTQLSKLEERTITSENREKFISLLKNVPKGKITVRIHNVDGGDTPSYANAILDLCSEAGFDCGHVASSFDAPPSPKGVTIVVPSATNTPPFARAVQDAFKAIGVDANGAYSKMPFDAQFTIMVGSKP